MIWFCIALNSAGFCGDILHIHDSRGLFTFTQTEFGVLYDLCASTPILLSATLLIPINILLFCSLPHSSPHSNNKSRSTAFCFSQIFPDSVLSSTSVIQRFSCLMVFYTSFVFHNGYIRLAFRHTLILIESSPSLPIHILRGLALSCTRVIYNNVQPLCSLYLIVAVLCKVSPKLEIDISQ